MNLKSLVLMIVVGSSLAVAATDAIAQRGRGGPGSPEPSADGDRPSVTGRGRGGRFGSGGKVNNPLFAALDSNGDGMITMEELENAPKLLAKLDQDKDGKLTLEEVDASALVPAAGTGGRGRRGAGGATAAGPGRGPGGMGIGRGGPAGRGVIPPANPAAGEANSKSPFDE